MNVDNREYVPKGSREIPMESKFLELIRSGKKTLDLRVAFPDYATISPGDTLIFKDEISDDDDVEVQVSKVAKYNSVEEVLEAEELSKFAPGASPDLIKDLFSKSTFKQLVKAHGILAIEFQKI